MQWLRVALCVTLVVVLGGCRDDPPKATGPAALKYVPADADAVLVVPTDLEGEQLQRLNTLLEPMFREGDEHSVRDVFASFFEDVDMNFARDVEPLLGEDLVVAEWGDEENPNLLAAIETPDGERADALGRKLDLDYRVDGDTLLISINGDTATLEPPADSFDPAAFGDDEGPALVRLAGNPALIVQALEVDVDLPWIQALEGLSASIRLEDDAITARAHLTTRPDGLSDEDLPLAPGDDAPQAADEDGAISSGNRNQSQTTVFLAQLARKAWPDSDFVAEVELAEKDLGIAFEDEVLKQFNGPSASVAWPDGNFAAVSEVADPDRMRELLPRLAPRLPGILRSLQSLGNKGLVALLLVAPDAPLVPGALPLLQQGDIGVRRLAGEDLYELTGLADEGNRFTVPAVVFGMLDDDRFVVASGLDKVRSVADLEVSDVDDAHGGAVARTDFSTWDSDPLGLETAPLGKAVGELEASREGIDARLRIERK
jgi:Protein of unknown function (DUF3352)